MPRKKVTQLRKLCGQLAGHSEQQAERAAQSAIELVRPWLPEGQEVVDLQTFLIALGRRLEWSRTGLTAVDDEHMHELQIDRNVREERDQATADLRELLIPFKDGLNGLYGLGGANKIFEEAAIIPTDPVALVQLTGRVIDNLDNEDFAMPKPLQRAFKLDRKEAVRELRPPYQRLSAALVKLDGTQSESKYSQSRKDRNVSDVDVFGNRAARFLEAFYALIGLEGLAKRVRRSSHRAASAEAAPDGESEGDGGGEDEAPEPGDAEAGQEAPAAEAAPAIEPAA